MLDILNMRKRMPNTMPNLAWANQSPESPLTEAVEETLTQPNTTIQPCTVPGDHLTIGASNRKWTT